MEVFETIKTRRSIRAYKPEPISDESLNKVLEAARIAPSASNRQEYKFIVVKEEDLRQKLATACNKQMWIADAPAVIVGCATNPSRRYSFVDVAIAMDHMTLVARSLGLGTCWIGAFSEPEVKRLLGIPDEVSVVCCLPIGVPAQDGVMRSRKSFQELFTTDTW
jgi:nitroreductase